MPSRPFCRRNNFVRHLRMQVVLHIDNIRRRIVWSTLTFLYVPNTSNFDWEKSGDYTNRFGNLKVIVEMFVDNVKRRSDTCRRFVVCTTSSSGSIDFYCIFDFYSDMVRVCSHLNPSNTTNSSHHQPRVKTCQGPNIDKRLPDKKKV